MITRAGQSIASLGTESKRKSCTDSGLSNNHKIIDVRLRHFVYSRLALNAPINSNA